MRILFHHRIASRDGQAVHVEELITALQALGHETILVGPPGFMATNFGASSGVVDNIKRWLPAAVFELLEIAYNAKAFPRLYRAVRVHRPDVIYERFSLFLFAGICVHRLSGIPILLEVNAPLYEEREKNDGLRLHRLGRWAQRLIWHRVSHVLPVTGVLARTVVDYGVPSCRITVIPNGINPARFGAAASSDRAKADLGLPPRLVLGFTGFIRGWNAVHRLIDFVALHKATFDLHVLVVGDGPARESLEDHARAQGLSGRMTITGIVERDSVARFIAAFDIAVLPGVTAYSSPLKLFEYLQLGCAIVAPDIENMREILTDGQNALLFDPARIGTLEEALLQLCGDAALRARLGQSAKETISLKALTWGHNAQRVVAIAQTELARRSTASDLKNRR
jgi:glycosyltransferase involved in cell wall biosynthesis